MKNLEPRIYRKRLIIEAKYDKKVTRRTVREYLLNLAKEISMKLLFKEPIITSATGKGDPIHVGYEGVLFWVASGAVIYIWTDVKFLTLEIYSCKPFNDKKTIEFTKRFFNIREYEHLII